MLRERLLAGSFFGAIAGCATARGQGELRLDYRRPWEKDVAPAQSARWKIDVR